jgi:hypothetical protein
MIEDKDIWTTRDISLAGTLVTLEFPLIDISYQIEGVRSQPTGYFNFRDSEKLQVAVKSFWEGKLAVEPRALMASIRSLKSQVSTVYKNPLGVGRDNANKP